MRRNSLIRPPSCCFSEFMLSALLQRLLRVNNFFHSLPIYFYSFCTTLTPSKITEDKHNTLSSGVTHLPLFSLSICSSVPSSSPPLSDVLPVHPPLPLFLFLILTLPDSVSMLSRTNPPLRGVKAPPHAYSYTCTYTHHQSRSRKVSICHPVCSNGIFYT